MSEAFTDKDMEILLRGFSHKEMVEKAMDRAKISRKKLTVAMEAGVKDLTQQVEECKAAACAEIETLVTVMQDRQRLDELTAKVKSEFV